MSIGLVIATQSAGSVMFHDWMYESRFFFTDKLLRMGARITLCDPHRVLVQGPTALIGSSNISSPDIRAGMALLLAGFPASVPGLTVNRLCASGLAAVNIAARAIRAGDGDVYIAGGVESMSRAPYSVPKAEEAFSFGNLTAWDTTLGWRYPNPKMKEMYGTEQMGETAENIAIERPHLTRELQDEFAVRSHQRAIAAIDGGRFAEEIVPVPVPQKKGEPVLVTTDERPRRDTSMESLARLKPAFRKEGGTVTAGNSSGLNDGAAAILIMSEERASQLELKPIARLAGSGSAGVEPRIMGLGPVPAVKKALCSRFPFNSYPAHNQEKEHEYDKHIFIKFYPGPFPYHFGQNQEAGYQHNRLYLGKNVGRIPDGLPGIEERNASRRCIVHKEVEENTGIDKGHAGG
jgi:hypothetical protein